PSRNGFLAAFTSPMLITGGAKLFSTYTSKETFNGEVIIRFSTDGKFLIVGKLNFAADNLSISGKLYADLSTIASGAASVLFLAAIPDQIGLLTSDGKFKMGFRDASGGEVTLTVEPRSGSAAAKVINPADGSEVGKAVFNARGYIDVSFPALANATLKPDSL